MRASLKQIMVAAMLVVAVPSAEATYEPDPVDLMMRVLNMTIEYVENFDPNDNATTMAQNTERFVLDLVGEVGEFICLDFSEGLTPLDWLVPNVGQRKLYIPAYGKDSNTGQEGVGVLTIEIDPTHCALLRLGEVDHEGEAPGAAEDESEEVMGFAESFALPSPAFS